MKEKIGKKCKTMGAMEMLPLFWQAPRLGWASLRGRKEYQGERNGTTGRGFTSWIYLTSKLQSVLKSPTCCGEGVAHSGVEMQFVSDRHVTPL